MAHRSALPRLASAILLCSVLQVEATNNGLIMKRVLDLYSNKVGQKVRLVNVTYERCGQESDPGRLDKLEITSTPKGDAVVTLSASTKVDLKSPLQVKVELHRRVFGSWIRVPCIANIIGSCVHEDFCQYGFNEWPLESFRKANIPSRCPIQKGTYSLNQAEIPVPLLPNPRLIAGVYKVQVVVKYGGTQIACYSGSGTVQAHKQ